MFNDKSFITLLFFVLLGLGLSGCNTVCPDKTTVGLKSDVAVLKEKVSKMEKDMEEAVWNTLDSNNNQKNKKKKKKKKKKLNVQ